MPRQQDAAAVFVLVTMTVCLSQKSVGGNIISARVFQMLGDEFFQSVSRFLVLMKQTSGQLAPARRWREDPAC